MNWISKYACEIRLEIHEYRSNKIVIEWMKIGDADKTSYNLVGWGRMINMSNRMNEFNRVKSNVDTTRLDWFMQWGEVC